MIKKKQSKLSQRLPSHKKKAPLTSYNTIYVQIFPLAFKKNVAERFGIQLFSQVETSSSESLKYQKGILKKEKQTTVILKDGL